MCLAVDLSRLACPGSAVECPAPGLFTPLLDRCCAGVRTEANEFHAPVRQ